MNKITSSIYFDKYNTFLTIAEKNNNSNCLIYVNAYDYINLNDINIEQTNNNITNIVNILHNYNVTDVDIVLSNDYYDIMVFPGSVNTAIEDNKEIINFEFSQYFGNKENISNYDINIVETISTRHNTKKLLYASLISKELLLILHKIFDDINNIKISYDWLNIINNFIHNYPELAEANTFLIGISRQYLEIMLISNLKLLGYELIRNDNDILNNIDSKIQEIGNCFHVHTIDNILLYGNELYKDTFLRINEILSKNNINVNRLNSFRILEENMEQSDKEHSASVYHLFAPCINDIPLHIENIKF